MEYDYSSPENLIASMRQKREDDENRRNLVNGHDRQNSGEGTNSATIASDVFRATSANGNTRSRSVNSGYEVIRDEEREDASGSYGGVGSTESGTGSDGTTSGESSWFDNVVTGSGSGDDKSSRSVDGEYKPSSFGRVKKSKFTPFIATVKNVSSSIHKSATKKTSSSIKSHDQKTSSSIKKRPLTDAEALRLHPKLVDLFLWQSENADSFISATTRGHKPVHIWSTMSKRECEILANFFIRRAKVSIQAAIIVRNLTNIMEDIEAVAVVAPRTFYTVKTYIERGLSLK